MKTVSMIVPATPHYRLRFYNIVRAILSKNEINFSLFYSDPFGYYKGKNDSVEIEWATKIPFKVIKTPFGECYWQSIPHLTRKDDLLILVQENSLIANYKEIVMRRILGKSVAYFGHGKNFQSKNPLGPAEKWKRIWSTKVNWWFTYTIGCRNHLVSNGFAPDRVTIFNNSIDLNAIAVERTALERARIESLRNKSFCGSDNIAVYVGGIYKEKRIEFMIAAARKVRETVPDFQLIVIGAGSDAALVEHAAKDAPWIHYQGPKFGMDKTELVSLAKVWLMPGLVGLAVLDSFAYETPMITTQLPYHSPEFDYLEDGVNGVVVPESDDSDKYASAVIRVLSDESYREQLIEGARLSQQKYSINQMAERFAEGVIRALK